MMDLVSRDWWLTPERVAVHRPSATAVIADVHLGYHEARRQQGEAIPVPSVEDALAPLVRVCQRYDLKHLVVAGDLFEKTFCPILWRALLAALASMHVRLAALVPGNHDRRLPDGLEDESPIFPDGFPLDDWLVVHGDGVLPERRCVMGHVHPSVVCRGRKCPCYVVGPRSLILPAFSAEAAGYNVWHDPRYRGHVCHAIVGGTVVRLGPKPGLTGRNRNSRPWQGRLFRG